MTRIFRLFTLLALVVLAASPASGQSRQLVMNQLQNAASIFSSENYTTSRLSSGTPTVGLIGDGTRAYLELQLEGGRDYLISGFCDEDCSDLDLVLRSEQGEILATDDELDDVPILRLTPSASGRYLLGITMVDCETELCYFGYSVFEKTIDI